MLYTMKKLKTYSYSALILMLSMLWGCIEEVDFRTLRQEAQTNLLVVEASLTNELKSQEITLSRTYSFDENGPVPEVGATVRVIDEAQNEFLFSEVTPGQYNSNEPFSAQRGVAYTLNFTTRDGRAYSSEPEQFDEVADLQGILAERTTNDLGEEGMTISVSSISITENTSYYRYTYEETYKIIAPNWTNREFQINNSSGNVESSQVTLVERQEEARVCFKTDKQNEIILNDASFQTGSGTNKFQVRFINRNNYILSHRYSILVKQLVQSPKAFSYYRALRDFSTSESIFSEVQPGFLTGNISSLSTSNENVIGYFEVSSVSSQRIFFDYQDYFPNETLPSYPVNCTRLFAPPEGGGDGCPTPLFLQILLDNVQYVDVNPVESDCEGPYLVTRYACGDCRALGSNVVPDFWEE